MPVVKLYSTEELKQVAAETIINKSGGKVTKITDNSILNGVSYAIGKIGQKALKEIALIESIVLPDSAFGDALDVIADKNGIAPRFGSSESSTYVRIVADPGTEYLEGINQFLSDSGIVFDLEDDVTIGSIGFTYAKVRSTTQGSSTNVPPFDINRVNPEPAGHRFVINEFQATGGRDFEQDSLFRLRIKEGPNILAKGTLSALEQAFNKINSNVLRCFYQGINEFGKTIIAIATQNGIDLTQEELDELLERGEDFFCITDLRPFGSQTYGIQLKNIEYYPIDVSFRIQLLQNFDPDTIRLEIQNRFGKLVDFRFWKPGSKVSWTDLLSVVKNTTGVRNVADQFFNPRVDIKIPAEKLPRFRSFLMLNLDGSILLDNSGNINPIFYPAQPDVSFQSTVLSSI